ncbi:MAG: hypothetical protein ACTSQJ_08125 [Promethearchaeota archaeon]
MSMKIIETEDGQKFRQLTELRQSAGKEYQDIMLKRVEYFSKKYSKDSIFNNFIENTIVRGLSTILDLKVKIDEALGDNKEKVQNFIEKILLFGI